jgi:outer membrane protein
LKKLIIVLAAIIATHSSFAQQKVGYLNSTDIMQSMTEYKTMSEAIEKKKGEYSKMMENMYAEYDKKTKDLQSDPNMAKPMQDMKVQELKDLEKRMNDFQQKAQGDLQTYAQEIAKPLQAKFQSAVKDIAKEQGYSYILDLAANSVVYYPESGGDISAAVKTKLGANLTPPAPKPAASRPSPRPAGK